jgi:uncharacterized membrane protein YfcA
MGTYGDRQYKSLSTKQQRTRDSKVAFVWIAFAVLLLFIVLGSIWLSQGNSPHNKLMFGIVMILMAALCFIAQRVASDVPVRTSTEEWLLDAVERIFGLAAIFLGAMAVIMVAVGFAGGS